MVQIPSSLPQTVIVREQKSNKQKYYSPKKEPQLVSRIVCKTTFGRYVSVVGWFISSCPQAWASAGPQLSSPRDRATLYFEVKLSSR